MFLGESVLTFIEGSHANTSTCVLSAVTSIPFFRLHGNSIPLDHCGPVVHMSAGYKDYAHASLDIISTFQWDKVALVFGGKNKSKQFL